MRQFTEKEALHIFESRIWQNWNDEQIVKFQLFQNYLCLNFKRFHKALAKVLARAVFSHEIAYQDKLIQEYLEKKKAPSYQEIISFIPKDKQRMVIPPELEVKSKQTKIHD